MNWLVGLLDSPLKERSFLGLSKVKRAVFKRVISYRPTPLSALEPLSLEVLKAVRKR